MKQILFFFLSFFFLSCSQLPKRAERPFFTRAWSKNLDAEVLSGNLAIGRPSPSMYRDIIYIGDIRGFFHAFDKSTGREIWREKENSAIEGEASFHKDQVLYVTYEGRLFSRHYLTGKLNYAIDLGSPANTKPLIARDRLFVHLRNHQIMALDVETGKILWSYKRSVPFLTTLDRFATPVLYRETIIVGMADGYLLSFDLNTGEIIWEQKISTGKKFVDVDVPLLLIGSSLFSASAESSLQERNASTGKIIRKFAVTPLQRPLKLGRSLYMGNLSGEIIRLSLDSGKISRKKISKDGIGPIEFWKKHLVVGTYTGELIAVDPVDLGPGPTILLGHAYSSVQGHFVNDQDILGLYSSRNRLYIFK